MEEKKIINSTHNIIEISNNEENHTTINSAGSNNNQSIQGYRIKRIKQTLKIYVGEKKIINSTHNIIEISNNEKSHTIIENLANSSRFFLLRNQPK